MTPDGRNNNGFTFESLNEALTQTQVRFRTIFEQAPFSIQICNPQGRTLLVNQAFRDLWGVSDSFVHDYILKDYNILEDPLLEAKGILEQIKKAFAGEKIYIPEFPYDPSEVGMPGRLRWAEGTLYPIKDAEGKLQEVVIIHTDVTERRAARETERRAEAGQRFLVKASEALHASLDHHLVIEQLANAAIPDLADGCIVDIRSGGKIQRLTTQHREPAVQLLLKELQQRYPPTLDSPQPSARVFRTGEPELLRLVDLKEIRAHTIDDRHAELIQRIGMRSHIAVPIIARGEIIGTASLFITSDRTLFDEQDLEISIEFARRAALALDNSRLYEKLRTAVRVRDEFISIASHELKTPITSMKLKAALAHQKLTEPSEPSVDMGFIRRMVDTNNRQLTRLAKLVDDLLDVSRMQSGKLQLQQKEVDLSLLVQEIADGFSEELSNLSIALTTDIQPGLQVRCDPFRIEQVLTNLISNAIRYGDQSPIRLSLSALARDVQIVISDQGRGIPLADHERIFERFERIPAANEVHGLGLGLYISRKLIDAHQGTIHLESQPGHGATFTIEFPLWND